MGQKVNPLGFRLQDSSRLEHTWGSIWFTEPKRGNSLYAEQLHEDLFLKNYLKGFLRNLGLFLGACRIERKCNGSTQLKASIYQPDIHKIQPSQGNKKELRAKQILLEESLTSGWLQNQLSQSFLKSAKNQFQGNIIPSKIEYFNFLQSSGTSRQLAESKIQLDKVWLGISKEELSFIWTGSSLKSQFSSMSSTYKELPSDITTLSPQGLCFKQFLTEKHRKNVILKNRRASWSFKSQNQNLESYISNSFAWKSTIDSNQDPQFKVEFHPLRTLVTNPQILVDYLVTRIETGRLAIPTLFQEADRLFSSEVRCLGSDFRSASSDGQIQEPWWWKEENLVVSSDMDEIETTNESSNFNYGDNVLCPDIIVLGYKIRCSGRLRIGLRSRPNPIAASIEHVRGRVPLQGHGNDIGFGQATSIGSEGSVGIKIWIYYYSRGNDL